MQRSYSTALATGALVSLLCAASAARAQSATVEIQGVAASDPGQKEQTIPASLARYKAVLKGTVFAAFRDAGSSTVKAAAGAKGSAVVAGYGVDVALIKTAAGKAKVEVTIKQGGKAIAQPLACSLSQGEPIMLSQLGAKDAPTILIFTLKDLE